MASFPVWLDVWFTTHKRLFLWSLATISAIAVGLAVVLVLVLLPSTPDAATELHKDGYRVVKAESGSDVPLRSRVFIESIAVGRRGDELELVIVFTKKGSETLEPLITESIAQRLPHHDIVAGKVSDNTVVKVAMPENDLHLLPKGLQ